MKKTKYVLSFKFEINGAVEKEQIIGAVFKHIDGLFWPDGDLGELDKRGQVGWIDVDLRTENNRTCGTVRIPLNADLEVIALVGASVETITNVSTFPAKFTLEKIEDVLAETRKWVNERAKEILRQLEAQIARKTTAALEELREIVIEKIRATQ